MVVRSSVCELPSCSLWAVLLCCKNSVYVVGVPWLVWFVLESGRIFSQQPQYRGRNWRYLYFPAPLAGEQGWFCALCTEGVATRLDVVLVLSSRLLNCLCSSCNCRQAASVWALCLGLNIAGSLRVVWAERLMTKRAGETKLRRAAGVLENRTRVRNDGGGVSCIWGCMARGFSPLTTTLTAESPKPNPLPAKLCFLAVILQHVIELSMTFVSVPHSLRGPSDIYYSQGNPCVS